MTVLDILKILKHLGYDFFSSESGYFHIFGNNGINFNHCSVIDNKIIINHLIYTLKIPGICKTVALDVDDESSLIIGLWVDL